MEMMGYDFIEYKDEFEKYCSWFLNNFKNLVFKLIRILNGFNIQYDIKIKLDYSTPQWRDLYTKFFWQASYNEPYLQFDTKYYLKCMKSTISSK